MSRENVYFGAIAYELGEIMQIENYYPLREQEDSIEKFHANGVKQIAVSAHDPNLLAFQACKQTLKKAGLTGKDIDAVIYASTSNWNNAFSNENAINWLMKKLEIPESFPIGIYLPGCANFSVALRVAKNLILSDRIRNVLIVASDKVNPACPEGRIFYPDITILSDGAASCIVSSDDKFEYKVEEIEHHSAPKIWDLNMVKNYSAFLLETCKGSKIAVDKLFQLTDVKRSDIKSLILNNFNIPTMKMLAKQTGFDESLIYMDNMSKFAHAFTADSLINLVDSKEKCKKGDYILMLAAAAKNWGVILVQKN